MDTLYTDLLKLAYETEGLICLLKERRDESPDNLKSMLKDKIAQMQDMTDILFPQPPQECDDACMTAKSMTLEQQEDADPFDVDDDVDDMPTEAAPLPKEDATIETLLAGTPTVELPPVETVTESPSLMETPIAEAEVRTEVDEMPEIPVVDDTAEIPVVDEKDNGVTTETVTEEDENIPMTLADRLSIDRAKAKDIRRAFTLNDRFRFKRELFGNSESNFSDALNVISAMSSIDEAEEYFYNDLCWSPENEEVKEFMKILANHFA